jgi:hypothetical protein
MKSTERGDTQGGTNFQNAFYNFNTKNDRVFLIENMLRKDPDDTRKYGNAGRGKI